MDAWRRTLILSDGGLPSLVACMHAREAAILGGVKPESLLQQAMVLAFVPQPEAVLLQRKAAATQAESLGLGWCGHEARGFAMASPQADDGEREAIELLGAALLAARLGCERVIWPATAGTSDSVVLDRLAQINDRALVTARLASIASSTATASGIVIDTPFAELSDRQVADLAMDIAAPMETCWWWARQSGDAVVEHERARWMSAMEGAGFVGAVRG
jgi:hypothetical protein